MKKFIITTMALAVIATAVKAATAATLTVGTTRYQTVTGFGAACCDGAMCPYGTAQGGNAEDQGYKKGKLRTDCYEKFFPWLNTFLAYMKKSGVAVDAVSLQNEPDWWVSYSGCLYDPQDLVTLVKNHAHLLDRETYKGVKLISGESLGFTQNYTDPLMKDTACRKQIDIVAGHLYGHRH